MKRIIGTATAIMIALASASCSSTIEPDGAFIDSTDVQLSVKGKVVCTYDPLTWQLSYSQADNEYRMFDDNMKSWCTIACSEHPAIVGQKVEARISWSTPESDGSERARLEVVKVQGNKCWLWHGSKNTKISVTVCNL